MQLTIAKSTITRLLQRVSPAVSPRATIPLLSCVLLDAADATLVARTSNTLTSIRAHAEAKVTSPGCIAVNAKSLADAVAKLPEGEVTLKVDGAKLIIRAGKSRFSLPTVAGEDFPPLPTAAPGSPNVVVKASALASLLASVSYASSSDDTRPHLCGVCLDADPGEMRGTTTDGHRLATSTVETLSGAFDVETLPTHAFAAVKSFAGDKSAKDANVTITIGAYLHLACGDVEVAAARVSDKFPEWKKVVPQGSLAHRVNVSRDALVAGVKLCAAVLDKSGGVRMRLTDGQLALEAKDGDGEASTELDVDYAGSGLNIAFSPTYMIEALESFDSDDLVIECDSALSPMRITAMAEPTTAVVMPQRGA